MLKIGTLCWLVHPQHLPQYAGCAVEVAGPLVLLRIISPPLGNTWVYPIRCREHPELAWELPCCLLPFSDPDSSVDERKPQLIEA